MSGADFKVGDRVIKNPKTWIGGEFDSWGAGEGGVGEVVGVFLEADEVPDVIDVRWPKGKAYQLSTELILVSDPPAIPKRTLAEETAGFRKMIEVHP